MGPRAGSLFERARIARRRRLRDHAGGDRVVRGLVDDDERAGGADLVVGVGDERGAEPQANAADLVEGELAGGLVGERDHVEPVLDRVEPSRDRAGGVLDEVARADACGLVPEPAQRGLELADGLGRLGRAGQQVPAARITYWTGRRAGPSATPLAAGTDSRCSSSDWPPYHGIASERSTTLSPCSAETGMKPTPWRPSREAQSSTSRATASKRSSAYPTRSILLTSTVTLGTPSSAAMARWRRDCSVIPRRASTSTSARSAVEAPVAMLRVYCAWPGQSWSTKRRFGVAKWR